MDDGGFRVSAHLYAPHQPESSARQRGSSSVVHILLSAIDYVLTPLLRSCVIQQCRCCRCSEGAEVDGRALTGAGGLEGGGRRAVQHGFRFGYAPSGTPLMMLPQHRRGIKRWMVLVSKAAASSVI
jgi:hypothetical protein